MYGVHWPDVETFVAYGYVVQELSDPVAWWIYRGVHKDRLFAAWRKLTEVQKRSLDYVHRQIFGVEPLTLYRRITGYQAEGLAGASFTDDPALFDKARPYRVDPSDLLITYRTPEFGHIFGNALYGHERELILKPDARPTPLTGSASRSWPWLPLEVVLAAEPAMQARGVSRVARSQRGFLRAYERARGNPRRLGNTPRSTPNRDPYPWQKRRDEFVARHMAQLEANGEPLWEEDGTPTRRHLSLIAWAYSPEPEKLRAFLREESTTSPKAEGLAALLERIRSHR